MMSLLPSPFFNFLSEHDFYDAILIDQDGGRHHVSKVVLAVHSNFFLALFNHSPEDKTEFNLSIVKRTSSSAAGLGQVLRWMEHGELELREENILDVLQTAEYLHINRLSHICQQVGVQMMMMMMMVTICSGWRPSWSLAMPWASGAAPRSCS